METVKEGPRARIRALLARKAQKRASRGREKPAATLHPVQAAAVVAVALSLGS